MAPVRGCDCRERRGRVRACLSFLPLNRLDQHRPALTATDALGCDARCEAQPMHGIDEMQYDAVATGADWVTNPNGATVNIESLVRDAAGNARKAKCVAAKFLVLPGREATENLCGERLIQFPQIDITKRVFVPFQDFGRAEYRPKTHDRRIERRPFAVENN